jgi:hypothetical protein
LCFNGETKAWAEHTPSFSEAYFRYHEISKELGSGGDEFTGDGSSVADLLCGVAGIDPGMMASTIHIISCIQAPISEVVPEAVTDAECCN